MAKAAEEAKVHLEQAEKALKTSFMSLKFSPDVLTASLECTQAATKFRSANMLPESAAAWARAGEFKEQLGDLFGAGRAYESAGALGEGAGSPQGLWDKAVRCFRLAGKGEVAAGLLLKLAARREKEGDITGAKAAFEDAIEVYTAEEKDYNLGDVYKQYTGFLLRVNAFDDACKAIDGHVALLAKQKQTSFVHKEVLGKVAIMLHLGDTVRAEEALNGGSDFEGWWSSKECQVGSDMVAAFQARDPAEVERLAKEQVWSFLQVEAARLARQLRLAAGAAGEAPPAGEPAPAVDLDDPDGLC